ncbi:L,D-transpeptidase [Geobacter sp. DSM 9736]|uniref:L,D-transpeptidase n=1 Tax=Geobacter sp. DSM 9736 TaxID=1277350 RepID=UPI000B505D0D|nr:L,D-transpeptidase [Geobacter sp. DSM 9736]SNB46254.1 L,D-transpeptidase catalytic domain [Geobacter sp. DSM 9736]
MKIFILAWFFLLAPCLGTSWGNDDETPISSLCDIHYPSDDRIEWECVELEPKDDPNKLFGDYWEDVLRFNRLDRRHFVGGLSIKVPKRLEDVDGFSPLPETLPEAAKEEKFILVDLSEMFLGAYQYGELVDSYPVAAGIDGHPVPTGEFRIDAVDRRHESNLYDLEELERAYPMHYGLRFFVDKKREGWLSYWIHGRDLPGFPASHGCVGLYDEEMQREYYSEHDRKAHRKYYRELKEPFLKGARDLYEWVVGNRRDPGTFHTISYGPKVLITGSAPVVSPR